MNRTLSDLSLRAIKVRYASARHTLCAPVFHKPCFTGAGITGCEARWTAGPPARRFLSPDRLRSRSRERSAVISRPVEQDTDLADRGSLRSQRLAPTRAEPTDDCSPLTQPLDLFLERLSPLRVVPKPVEA